MLGDSGLQLEDLRDRDQLFDKLQGSMEPQDMGRMMELFSEFMGTDEGRAFVEELDGMAEDFEGMMNGERGERMGQLMERLIERHGIDVTIDGSTTESFPSRTRHLGASRAACGFMP